MNCQATATNPTAVNCQKVAPTGLLLPWQCASGQLLPLPRAMAVTGAGVYKLLRNGSVVYVGACVNIQRRINEHRYLLGVGVHGFDNVEFAAIADAKERRKIELKLIRLHRPQLNKTDNPPQRQFTKQDVLEQLGDRRVVGYFENET